MYTIRTEKKKRRSNNEADYCTQLRDFFFFCTLTHFYNPRRWCFEISKYDCSLSNRIHLLVTNVDVESVPPKVPSPPVSQLTGIR